jgi:glycosyltransferase involved in cell wall biosynthesis
VSKLAIVVSHPIQYFSPLFAALAEVIELKVFYCYQPNEEQQGHDGFGKAFKWDIDLFEGYDFEFLQNVSKKPSSSIASGCDTPKVGESLKECGATHVVVFGWHLKSYKQTLKYCRTAGIPIAVRGDSILQSNASMTKSFLKKILYPVYLSKFSAFLSVGTLNRKYLKNYYVPDKKIIYSPHAVNQNFWSGKRIESEVFTFIWVAKFMKLKRPLDVINAFLELSVENPDIRLKMVGTGDLLDECVLIANGNSNIEFLGFKNQKELRKEYLASNCLILSSDSETWGLVVNEAFAAGIPAIVSDSCGCFPDLITKETGAVYQTGNVDQLKMEMVNIINRKNENRIDKAINQKNLIHSYDTIVLSFKEFINRY